MSARVANDRIDFIRIYPEVYKYYHKLVNIKARLTEFFQLMHLYEHNHGVIYRKKKTD
jgi:hypothetical protein